MKKIINEVLFGKDAKLSGFIALTVIMLIALGCTCGDLNKFKDDSKDEKPTNSADNKSSKSDSTSNSSKDSPFPSDDDATPAKKSPDVGQKKSSDKNMPSDEETEALVKDLITQIKNGVENEDFTDLQESSSDDFRRTYTANQLKTNFAGMIANKERVVTVLESIDGFTPEYTETPSIAVNNGFKVLTTKGTFATSPVTTFDYSYVLEKGSWKMLTFNVQFKK
jgi:hypothetical protein